MPKGWTGVVSVSRVFHTYLTMFGLPAVSSFATTGLMLSQPR